MRCYVLWRHHLQALCQSTLPDHSWNRLYVSIQVCWLGALLMHLSIASPPPPPLETMGDLTASLCPGMGNLTTRWVTGVGHIDRRQSALWSPRVQGGVVWPFRLSPGGELGYIWPPTLVKSPPTPGGGGGGGGTLGHAIDRCITKPWGVLRKGSILSLV